MIGRSAVHPPCSQYVLGLNTFVKPLDAMRDLFVFSVFVLTCTCAFAQGDAVCNPSFEMGLSDWQHFANSGAVADFDTSASASIAGSVGALVDIQDVSSGTCVLSACVANMYANQTYRMSFWAKSEGNVELLATISKASPGYTNFASATLVLSDEWSQYEITGGVAEDLISDVRLAKFKFLSEGVAMIDDVQIEVLPLSPELCQGSFEEGFNAWAVNQNNGSISAEVDDSTVVDGLQSVKLTVDNVEEGVPIFSSCPSYLPGATSLLVHFWAKSDVNGAVMEAKTALQSSPFTVYGETEVTLSETWQEFTFTAYSENELNAVRLAKFAFETAGTFWIDHVWFEEVLPSPVLCNGDFEAALDAWVTSVSEDAEATVAATPATAYDGVISAYAEVTSPGALPSSVQLASCRASAVQDSTYTVSIWLKGSQPGLAFNVSTAYADSPFQALYNGSFVTDSDWSEYCWQFTADSTVYEGIRLVKIQFLDAGTYYLDAASLQALDYTCSNEPQGVAQNAVDEVMCYPNPAQHQLQVLVPSAWGTVQGRLCSNSGQLVRTMLLTGRTALDLQFLPSGLYFLSLVSTDGRRITKTIQVSDD